MKLKRKMALYLKLMTGEEIVANCRYAGMHCFLLEAPLKIVYQGSAGSMKLMPWIPTLESLHDTFCFDILKTSIVTAVEAPQELSDYYAEAKKGYLHPNEILKDSDETDSDETDTNQTFH